MLAAFICSERTPSRRLTLGMRFRFLLDLLALLVRFVAMIISSFDLVSIYPFNLPVPVDDF